MHLLTPERALAAPRPPKRSHRLSSATMPLESPGQGHVTPDRRGRPSHHLRPVAARYLRWSSGRGCTSPVIAGVCHLTVGATRPRGTCDCHPGGARDPDRRRLSSHRQPDAAAHCQLASRLLHLVHTGPGPAVGPVPARVDYLGQPTARWPVGRVSLRTPGPGPRPGRDRPGPTRKADLSQPSPPPWQSDQPAGASGPAGVGY